MCSNLQQYSSVVHSVRLKLQLETPVAFSARCEFCELQTSVIIDSAANSYRQLTWGALSVGGGEGRGCSTSQTLLTPVDEDETSDVSDGW